MKILEPDLVKKKPKPKRNVLAPEVVVKKKKAKKTLLMPQELMKRKKEGIHEDSIPPGTLCYLRKRAKEMFGFDYCTVLETRVSQFTTMAWADVLTPDGNIKTIDIMWLRNVDVQNGNIDEDEENAEN